MRAVAVIVMALSLASGCGDAREEQPLFADAPVLVEVPSVVGESAQFAAGVLSTIGSPTVVEHVEGLEGSAGMVAEQVPVAGAMVTLGSPVIIRVPADPDDRSVQSTTETSDPSPEEATTTSGATTTATAPETTPPSPTTSVAVAASSVAVAASSVAPTSTTPPPTTQAPEATTTVVAFPVSESTVLTAAFAWGEQSSRVGLLQQVLGITADGIYGPSTRDRHLSTLQSRGLSTAAVPEVPSTTTTTVAPTTTTTTTSTTTVPVTTTTLYSRSLGLIPTDNSYTAALNVGQRDAWIFTGVAAGELIVRLTSSDLDVHLRVYDPSGQLIGDNDNTAGTNSYLKLVLCTTGNYTITADGTLKTSIATSSTEYTVSLEGGAATTTASLAAYFASTTCN